MTHEEARALGLRLLAACAALGIDALRLGMPVRHDKTAGLAVVVSRGTAPGVVGAWSGCADSPYCWPDLREGAGRGIALDLVRDALGAPDLWPMNMAIFSATTPGWMVDGDVPDGMVMPSGDTEAGCLVATLEAKAGIR